jgi:hypothetical protein
MNMEQGVMNKILTSILGMFFIAGLAVAEPPEGKGKPDKPGGGGDPVVVAPGDAAIDGDLSEWGDCDTFASIPLHWAGAKNKPVLVRVCLRYDYDNGLLFVRGLAEPGDVINDKPDSTHMKLNKVKLWDDADRGVDGIQPEWQVYPAGTSTGGFPIVHGWEASAYVQPGQYKTVIHASVCPGGDCNEGAGQSSRTLKGLEILIP